MTVAVVGSRNLVVLLSRYMPRGVTRIVSGGARGVDTLARVYAETNGIPFVEFLPDYELYGLRAPLERNDRIIAEADLVLAFWDGRSRGTKYVIDRCVKQGKPVRVFRNL